MARLTCHTCGAPAGYDEPIPRDSQCEKCGTDLRCCRNCRHWDARYSNECTETQADPVPDKTRRNFCEFFYFSRAEFKGAPGAGRDRAAEARAALEAMFGNPKPARPTVAGESSGRSAPDPPGDTSASAADRERARKADARANLEKLFNKPDAGSGE